MTSKIIESLREDMALLYKIGAIDKATLRGFDEICPAPVKASPCADDNAKTVPKTQD